MKFIKFIKFAILLPIILLLGCKKEEAILESETPPKYFYLVTIDQPNALKLFNLLNLKIENEDVFYSVNKAKLGEISQITEYRGFIYIFQKNAHRLTIVSADDLLLLKNLEWNEDSRQPSSITFANATTGFISFSDTSLVEVLDLTNFQIAQKIPTPSPISFLESVEQYVVGLSPLANEITIIDSRTYSVVKTIKTSDYPFSANYNPDKKTLFVLCAGEGKFDSTKPKTPSKIGLYEPPNFTNIIETIINIGSISSTEIVPTGIVSYGKYFGYIPTLSGLLRFSLSNPNQIQRYIAGEFYFSMLDFKREWLIALSKSNDQTYLYLINPLNAAVISRHLINQAVLLAFPK
ncbi:MAG: YncE family protein [Candidatus Kapaibacteriota bacterium]